MKNPYWLIKQEGKPYGVGAVEFDEAITSDKAIEVFLAQPGYADMLFGIELTAEVVTLSYVDGQPVVTAVK